MPEEDMSVAAPESWKTKGKKAGSVPALTGAETTQETPAPAEERTPEFGDAARYVDNHDERHRILDASIMSVFADKPEVNLRVLDPENAFGHFDVVQVEHDAGKAPGTFHFPEEA